MIDNRWVIGGIRTVAMVGGAYIVLSLFARIGRGEWAESIGPLSMGKLKRRLGKSEQELKTKKLKTLEDVQ